MNNACRPDCLPSPVAPDPLPAARPAGEKHCATNRPTSTSLAFSTSLCFICAASLVWSVERWKETFGKNENDKRSSWGILRWMASNHRWYKWSTVLVKLVVLHECKFYRTFLHYICTLLLGPYFAHLILVTFLTLYSNIFYIFFKRFFYCLSIKSDFVIITSTSFLRLVWKILLFSTKTLNYVRNNNQFF